METTQTVQILRLEAHKEYSYVPRTGENARGADVTVAFAADFTTAGERLTKREAGPRYVGIPFGEDPATSADALVKFLAARKGSSLNVAGNGIYTLVANGVTQVHANQWVFEVLSLVHARAPLSSIRSGGQTGIDQAGLVAAIALGVPAYGLYPKSFRRRNAEGEEVHSTAAKLERELTEQAAQLKRKSRRRFHPDGTGPRSEKAIFVFGSNLAGRHGKGSALAAREQFGAIYGQGEGLQGRSYGIPTKDGRPNTYPLSDPRATLSVEVIRAAVIRFINFAKEHPEMDFHVVRLGCDLAAHTNEVIAPLFDDAPDNCSFPEPWEPYMRDLSASPAVVTAAPVNLWSGARGIGGALTNMSERAREKGCIKHPYPVTINGVRFEDSEAAYQTLKIPGDDDYNDGLMIDIISLKFLQNRALLDWVTQDGGVAWLEKCSHFTNAKSPRAQSWEGQGYDSRFIRNLIHGYQKAMTGRGPLTRVVHVKEAPYDVYIGRAMGQSFTESIWANHNKVGPDMPRDAAVAGFFEDLQESPELLAQVGQLKGKTIGCWCKSRDSRHLQCHGDVLAALAEGKPWIPPQAVQTTLF